MAAFNGPAVISHILLGDAVARVMKKINTLGLMRPSISKCCICSIFINGEKKKNPRSAFKFHVDTVYHVCLSVELACCAVSITQKARCQMGCVGNEALLWAQTSDRRGLPSEARATSSEPPDGGFTLEGQKPHPVTKGVTPSGQL